MGKLPQDPDPKALARPGDRLDSARSRYLEGVGPSSRRALGQALDRAAEWLSTGRATATGGLRRPGRRAFKAEGEALPAGQSASSPSAASGATREDAAGFAWEKLTVADAAALREWAGRTFAPATANKMLAAVRGVIRTAHTMGLIDAASQDAVMRALERLPSGPRLSAPSDDNGLIDQGDVRRLFGFCARRASPAGRRDAAMLAIILSSGLRRAELAGLNVADYDPGQGRLHIRSAEPAKDRWVELSKPAQQVLADWLSVRPASRQQEGDAAGAGAGTGAAAAGPVESGAIRPSGTSGDTANHARTGPEGDDPLLTPVLKSGRVVNRRLTDQAVYDLVRRLGRQAGLPDLTTRMMRRSYVVSLIASGLGLEEVRQRVGHASWLTTAAYRALARLPSRRPWRPLVVPRLRPRNPMPAGTDQPKGGTP